MMQEQGRGQAVTNVREVAKALSFLGERPYLHLIAIMEFDPHHLPSERSSSNSLNASNT